MKGSLPLNLAMAKAKCKTKMYRYRCLSSDCEWHCCSNKAPMCGECGDQTYKAGAVGFLSRDVT